MLTPMLTALAICLMTSALSQLVLVIGFVRRLKSDKPKLLNNDDCPEGVVILCLRGGDPFLSKCIDGLLTQDYPNYRVVFMVDHPQDSAVAILNAALEKHEFNKYSIQWLTNPLETCSLKCSSLIQAISGLPSSTNFIALLDADTIPHSSWLRELATALKPNDVGAATGNRWYMPEQLSQGAIIRHIWNAAAVVQMYWYSIAWGGTLAVKLDSIRRAGLIERWSKSLCEDTMLRKQLANIGQRVEFVPSLMMINREDCSVASYVSWVKRQLLTAKLYHPFWFAVVGHGISLATFLAWGWSTVVYFVLQREWSTGIRVALWMIAFQSALSGMVKWLEHANKQLARDRGEPTDWNANLKWWQFAWSVWSTQWVYTWALVSCFFMRRIEWRGVEYDVRGSWDIRLREYRPMQTTTELHESKQSL